ncbi:hypothetical protein [Clostridium tyrobutyricum]|uniref:hypothetical protein n=1 Tax=Clostridium tyrobutyricum TaxID=1519 RepID=UPI00073D8038|nr:hypothetical protein [Clostridium tyrobutyricum]
MEQDYIFPIGIRKDGKELIVRFIDFDIRERRYEEKDDFITECKIILSNILLEYEQKKITIPNPKKIESIKILKNEQIVFLNIWLPFYRTKDEKYVRKTLTIPEWIDELAKKQNFNFSQILKEALIVELGLCDEIKKRKSYRFNKPMKNLEDFLIISQKIIRENIEQEREAFSMATNTKNFNLIVTIWVIWINKNISNFLKSNSIDDIKGNVEFYKQQWLKSIEKFQVTFKESIDRKCDEIANELNKLNVEKSITDDLTKYLGKFSERLLNAALKYDGIFERNESIYDYMRYIIDQNIVRKYLKEKYWEQYDFYNKFTLKYEIELPYIYVLIWHINDLYESERMGYIDKERKKNIENICYVCLENVSKTALEILLGNPIFSAYLQPKIIATVTKNGQDIPAITQVGSIDFSEYLPCFNCSKDKIQEYVNISKKIVSKEVLSRIPMTPMEIYNGDKVAIKYLVHSLCVEIQK